VHANDSRVEISTSIDGAAWDDYVSRHRCGQFQQSSAWAAVKGRDGWEPTWMVWRDAGTIVGGAQVLIKTTPFGRFGFVNKGPLVPEGPAWTAAAVDALVALERQAELRVLLVHPPDWDQALGPALGVAKFSVNVVLPLMSATLLVDLLPSWAAVERRFRRSRRQNALQAERRGVTILEGGDNDVPEFFRLMASTCQRQRTTPNPRSVGATAALWRAFSRPLHRARLHFANFDGRVVAGGLCLAFGDRVTFWKKGWDESAPTAHANTLLTVDAIRWAVENGYRWFDFAALDRDVAESRLAGAETVAGIGRRRDLFNLGFGGEPLLLPPSWLRFRARPLGAAYDLTRYAVVRELLRAVGIGERAHVS
jgi:hypothetical protein